MAMRFHPLIANADQALASQPVIGYPGLRTQRNPLRLYFSSFAYILLCALRNLGLQETEMADAQCGTIRTKLLKIGAQVRLSVRRVWIAFSESYPFAELLRTVLANLQGAPRWAGAP
jgi:hypothetical protein